MPNPSPTVLQPTAQEVGAATAHPGAPPARDRAHPLQLPRRLGARRGRGERALLIALAVVAGPPTLALAGALVMLAVAAAGPFFLLGILVVAFVIVAFVAMGSTA